MLFIAHGPATEHRHLRHGVVLQLLQRVSAGAQQLSDKVKLKIICIRSWLDKLLPAVRLSG